jgi:hypothetical protein
VRDLNCGRRLVFALSLHLAIAHVYVLPADMDLCRIDGHQFFVLHHLIGVVRRCECRARHHVADETDDHDQNFEPDDAHDHGHHFVGHAVHAPGDHDQNCELDDPNYRDEDAHDQNFEPDDQNYHDAGDLADHDQSCEPDDLIDH